MKYGFRSIMRAGLLALTAAALLGAPANQARSNDDRVVEDCIDQWDNNTQASSYCHPFFAPFGSRCTVTGSCSITVDVYKCNPDCGYVSTTFTPSPNLTIYPSDAADIDICFKNNPTESDSNWSASVKTSCSNNSETTSAVAVRDGLTD